MAFDVASEIASGSSSLFMLVWDAIVPTNEAYAAMDIFSGSRATIKGDIFTAAEFDEAKLVVQREYERWDRILLERIAEPLSGILEKFHDASIVLVMVSARMVLMVTTKSPPRW